jgi:hypothetical protein
MATSVAIVFAVEPIALRTAHCALRTAASAQPNYARMSFICAM